MNDAASRCQRDVAGAPRNTGDHVRYYTVEAYDEHEYEEDGRWITESFPYQAIREAPNWPDLNISHEIGKAHGEHWAKVIVDALNAAEKNRERREKRNPKAQPA